MHRYSAKVRLILFIAVSIPISALVAVWADQWISLVFEGMLFEPHPVAFYSARIWFVVVTVMIATGMLLFAIFPRRLKSDTGWLAPGRVVVVLDASVFMAMAIRETLSTMTLPSSPLLISRGFPEIMFLTCYRVGHHGALAVIAGWLLLFVSGEWRSRDDPADLPGRVIGTCWLSVTAVNWIVWAGFAYY